MASLRSASDEPQPVPLSTSTVMPGPRGQLRVQFVGDKGLDRTNHVWVKVGLAEFKCVLCGGVTKFACNTADCHRYERLTKEEKALCPEQDHKKDEEK